MRAGTSQLPVVELTYLVNFLEQSVALPAQTDDTLRIKMRFRFRSQLVGSETKIYGGSIGDIEVL